MRSKYGRPTLICTPRAASTTSGNTVPSSTVKVNSTNTRLLTRKSESRPSTGSIVPSGARRSMRSASRATDQTSASTRKTRIVGPIALCVNEWTELKTPERVMKVPRIVSRKVASTSVTVQPLRTPLRSVSSAECSAAVAVSHGRNDAFSTGSHAQ
jgi:hypothetical protein